MAEKDRKKVDLTEDHSILGDAPVLTAQERERLKREEKEQKKAEKRAQLKELREEAKSRVSVSSEKKQMNIILTVMVGIVMLILIATILGQTGKQNRADVEAREGSTYYIDNSQLAEMGDEGITGAITEVYYTESDGLRIFLNFANAEETTQHPTRIQIKLMNGKGDVITNAVSNNVHKDYYIVGGGRKTYELFVPKDLVKIPDDSLSEISYEITVDCEDYNSDD